MRKLLLFISFLLCSLGITIFCAIQKSYLPKYVLIGFQLFDLYGLGLIFYTEPICRFLNFMYAVFNLPGNADTEPSDSSILVARILGVIVVLIHSSLLFV